MNEKIVQELNVMIDHFTKCGCAGCGYRVDSLKDAVKIFEQDKRNVQEKIDGLKEAYKVSCTMDEWLCNQVDKHIGDLAK